MGLALKSEFRQREDWHLVVFLWLGVLLDDLVNQLANFGLQPDFTALRADERRDVFKFVELVTPLLPVGDVLGLQTPAALSTSISLHGYSALLTPIRW
jgi:hypothetical protein